MILANTTAGELWHNLINAECLTSIINSENDSNHLSQLSDILDQMSSLDTREVVYISNNGKPSICVSDIVAAIDKRIARYQSLALLSRGA